MARFVDPHGPGLVIELGPGTGPVTDALIRRGVAPERLVLVEYEAAFCKLLARRYPECTIVQGDAYALHRTLNGLLAEPAAAIVSSLPLLNRPERERLALLADAFRLMRPGAPFVQFTYGLLSPMPKPLAPASAPFDAKGSAPVWLNLPPARVWVYRAVDRAHEHDESCKPDLFDRLKAGGEKLGVEFREQHEKLRAEFQARSAEARAELKSRTEKVRIGLQKQSARLKAARLASASRKDRLAARRQSR